jgi:Zn ribbon nucleic-acid-binding protein
MWDENVVECGEVVSLGFQNGKFAEVSLEKLRLFGGLRDGFES